MATRLEPRTEWIKVNQMIFRGIHHKLRDNPIEGYIFHFLEPPLFFWVQISCANHMSSYDWRRTKGKLAWNVVCYRFMVSLESCLGRHIIERDRAGIGWCKVYLYKCVYVIWYEGRKLIGEFGKIIGVGRVRRSLGLHWWTHKICQRIWMKGNKWRLDWGFRT